MAKVEAEEFRDGGPVALEEVIAFGSRLCRTGGGETSDRAPTARVMGVEARLFQARDVKSWRAVAERLHREGGETVWHVRFFAHTADPIAMATLRLQDGPAAIHREPAPAPDREAIPEDTKEPAPVRRREQIAAAACDVIARKGFANATMREIASAAGLHVPTMYQYVTSKDEMLELVYRWIMDSVRTDVVEAAGPHESAADQLRAVIRAIIRRGDRFRHRIGVLNRELKSLSPPARRRVIAEYRGLLDQIASLIKAGIDSGEFRPVQPAIAANLVDAVCDIWPLRPFAVGHIELEAFGTEVSDFILAGLRP